MLTSGLGFMKDEAENLLKMPLANLKQQILLATRVAKKTYRKLCSEAKSLG